jgi:hypothetical protein
MIGIQRPDLVLCASTSRSVGQLVLSLVLLPVLLLFLWKFTRSTMAVWRGTTQLHVPPSGASLGRRVQSRYARTVILMMPAAWLLFGMYYGALALNWTMSSRPSSVLRWMALVPLVMVAVLALLSASIVLFNCPRRFVPPSARREEGLVRPIRRD